MLSNNWIETQNFSDIRKYTHRDFPFIMILCHKSNSRWTFYLVRRTKGVDSFSIVYNRFSTKLLDELIHSALKVDIGKHIIFDYLFERREN